MSAVCKIVHAPTDVYGIEWYMTLGYVLVSSDLPQPLCKVLYPDDVKYDIVQEAIRLTERLILANPKTLDDLCRICQEEIGVVRLSRPMEF